jgi:hypothetical protein
MGMNEEQRLVQKRLYVLGHAKKPAIWGNPVDFFMFTDPNDCSDGVHLNVPALGREAMILLFSLMLVIEFAVVRTRRLGG